MDTTTNTLSDDTVELDLSALEEQPENEAAQRKATHGSQRGGPSWRHLGAIVAGAMTLGCFALLVGPEAEAGDEHGCYVARYTNPADYPACGAGSR